jgi:hypothetical protein
VRNIFAQRASQEKRVLKFTLVLFLPSGRLGCYITVAPAPNKYYLYINGRDSELMRHPVALKINGRRSLLIED